MIDNLKIIQYQYQKKSNIQRLISSLFKELIRWHNSNSSSKNMMKTIVQFLELALSHPYRLVMPDGDIPLNHINVSLMSHMRHN
jgi:hypothetical protein